MRAMQITVLVFVFAGFLLQANAQHNTQREAEGNSISGEIIDKEKLTWELSKKKDKLRLATLLTEDFTEITDEGIFDKAGVLANLDGLSLTDYSATDFTIKTIAPNIVLLIYKVTVTGSFKGHAFKSDNYASSMWVKRDGGWQNVFFQETVLGPG
jgi:hypothetical protein